MTTPTTPPPAAAEVRTAPSISWWRACAAVARKEIVDTLRDRRTMLVVLLSSVLLGPALLFAMSRLVAELEADAKARDVAVVGLEHAPTLANHLERQGRRAVVPPLTPAPATLDAAALDAALAQALASRTLAQAVLVVPTDFEARLAAGLAPTVTLWTASGNRRAEVGARAWQQLLQGFQQEQATLRLATAGVAPGRLQVLDVALHDAAGARQRQGQLLRMLPMFVLMAVVVGAMHAALDATAGERERGSLEPLLMTPVPRGALVAGKWAAVAAVAMGIAVLACASFLPGQWWLASEALAANFHFGAAEAARFLALLLPLAALVAAAMMAVALRARSVREAQASASLVMLAVTLGPMLMSMDGGAERAWQLAVPAVAQSALMQRVLDGEAIGAFDLLAPCAVALAATFVLLLDVRRQIDRAAIA